jgi:hypothetical protein
MYAIVPWLQGLYVLFPATCIKIFLSNNKFYAAYMHNIIEL